MPWLDDASSVPVIYGAAVRGTSGRVISSSKSLTDDHSPPFVYISVKRPAKADCVYELASLNTSLINHYEEVIRRFRLIIKSEARTI